MVNGFGRNRGRNAQNFMQAMPMQAMPMQTAPTQFEPARVSPTQQYVQRNMTNTVVPHYHPSHLTTVNQHMIHNQHHFPHTQSVVNECRETHTMCGTPFRPNSCRRGWS